MKQYHWYCLLNKEGKVTNDDLHFINNHCKTCTVKIPAPLAKFLSQYMR